MGGSVSVSSPGRPCAYRGQVRIPHTPPWLSHSHVPHVLLTASLGVAGASDRSDETEAAGSGCMAYEGWAVTPYAQ